MARRIIIRGVNWLGDAVMSMSAVQRLREACPDDFLAMMTPAKLTELWRRHPCLDEVISIEKGTGVFAASGKVRAGGFDIALVLPNSPRSALEVFLGAVPRRIGFKRSWRDWLLTETVRSPGVPMRKKSDAEVRRAIAANGPGLRHEYPMSAHHGFRYLALSSVLGGDPAPVAPRLVVADSEVDEVLRKFDVASDSGISAKRIGFVPGAEYGSAKRWPLDRFIEVALRVHDRTRCLCWVFGGAADRELGKQFESEVRERGVPVRNLAGETNLRELCAALKGCHAVVTNDTGPMHLAAAVGTPVAAVFGSTSPELTGPGLPGPASHRAHRVLCGNAPCAPCFRRECPIDLRCLKSVTAGEISEAVLALL